MRTNKKSSPKNSSSQTAIPHLKKTVSEGSAGNIEVYDDNRNPAISPSAPLRKHMEEKEKESLIQLLYTSSFPQHSLSVLVVYFSQQGVPDYKVLRW